MMLPPLKPSSPKPLPDSPAPNECNCATYRKVQGRKVGMRAKDVLFVHRQQESCTHDWPCQHMLEQPCQANAIARHGRQRGHHEYSQVCAFVLFVKAKKSMQP
eukprot:1153840-Pelagomonas_calceolata.AAC.8